MITDNYMKNFCFLINLRTNKILSYFTGIIPFSFSKYQLTQIIFDISGAVFVVINSLSQFINFL